MIKFRAGAHPGATAGAVQAASTQPSPAPGRLVVDPDTAVMAGSELCG